MKWMVFLSLALVSACMEPGSPAGVGKTYNCDQSRCTMMEGGNAIFVEERHGVALIDQGMAYDGPAYMIRVSTGEILARCGGALMLASEEERAMCDFEYWVERQ